MRKSNFAPFASLLLLAACSSGQEEKVSGEEVAESLDKAAAQSGPAAKEVLEQRADMARKQEELDPVSKPDSYAQDAMEAAGEAESAAANPANSDR